MLSIAMPTVMTPRKPRPSRGAGHAALGRHGSGPQQPVGQHDRPVAAGQCRQQIGIENLAEAARLDPPDDRLKPLPIALARLAEAIRTQRRRLDRGVLHRRLAADKPEQRHDLAPPLEGRGWGGGCPPMPRLRAGTAPTPDSSPEGEAGKMRAVHPMLPFRLIAR